MKFLKNIELEAQRSAVSLRQSEADSSHLDTIAHEIFGAANVADPAQEYGLPRPDSHHVSFESIQERVLSDYSHAYAALNAKLVKESTRPVEADKVSAAKPAVLFSEAVHAEVSQVLQKLGFSSTPDVSMDDASSSSIRPTPKRAPAEAFVSCLQGNGPSPPGGHNARPAATARPERPRDHPKPPRTNASPNGAKGKGKGKMQDKGGKGPASKGSKSRGRGKGGKA